MHTLVPVESAEFHAASSVDTLKKRCSEHERVLLQLAFVNVRGLSFRHLVYQGTSPENLNSGLKVRGRRLNPSVTLGVIPRVIGFSHVVLVELLLE